MLSDRRLVSTDGFMLNTLFVLQQLNSKVKINAVSQLHTDIQCTHMYCIVYASIIAGMILLILGVISYGKTYSCYANIISLFFSQVDPNYIFRRDSRVSFQQETRLGCSEKELEELKKEKSKYIIFTSWHKIIL